MCHLIHFYLYFSPLSPSVIRSSAFYFTLKTQLFHKSFKTLIYTRNVFRDLASDQTELVSFPEPAVFLSLILCFEDLHSP